METSTDKLKKVLMHNKYSVTRQRTLIFSMLLDNHPLSIKDLVSELKDSVDRASIYRTLKLFERIGVVEKLHIGWKHKYELSDEFTHHHHHALCTKCDKIMNLEEEPYLEEAINRFAGKKLRNISSHSLEIKGICLSCK